jgi:hypothetical protein
MKNVNIPKGIIWLAAGLAAGYLVWWVVPAYFQQSGDARSVEYLGRVAAEINRSVPVMIDSETEILPTQAAPAMLIYNYRLVNYSVTQVNPQRFAAGVKEKVTPTACTRPETRDEFLKKGVTLRYSYFDKDKQHIATIDVTPADCGL